MFPKLTDLKRIRERVGWSQTQLSQTVGISQSSIPKYEKMEQVPSYEVATKIFEVLLAEELKIDPKVSEVMTPSVMSVEPTSKLLETLKLMKENSISQIPVLEKKMVIGTITEQTALDIFDANLSGDEAVLDYMEEALPLVPKSARLKEVSPLLRNYGAVLVTEKGEIVGIITKADLLTI